MPFKLLSKESENGCHKIFFINNEGVETEVCKMFKAYISASGWHSHNDQDLSYEVGLFETDKKLIIRANQKTLTFRTQETYEDLSYYESNDSGQSWASIGYSKEVEEQLKNKLFTLSS